MLHWNRVIGLAFVLNGWIWVDQARVSLGTSTLEPKTLEPKTQSSQAERAVQNRRVDGGGARPSRSY